MIIESKEIDNGLLRIIYYFEGVFFEGKYLWEIVRENFLIILKKYLKFFFE